MDKLKATMELKQRSIHFLLPEQSIVATVSGNIPVRSERMDAIREFLTAVRHANLVPGHLRGLLHILIGRKITRTDGTLVSNGLTWRETAAWLRQLRWDPQWANELGVDPASLTIRDRDRFWYQVIAQARLDSPQAIAEADKLAALLQPHGYVVGPPPPGLTASPSRPLSPPASPPSTTTPPRKRRKPNS